MKKKFLPFLLLAALTFGLAACGKGQDAEEESGTGVKVTLNEVAHSIFYAPMYVAIEEGYFKEEGIDLTLVTGFGADKTMTAVLSGEADIGFMGSESTIYTYLGGADDPVVNFAQLTQRAGNFLVSREPVEDFSWDMLKGHNVLGGRAGGMPEMVFEYILKKNGIDPEKDLNIDQSIDFGSTAAAFSGRMPLPLSRRATAMWWLLWARIPAMCPIPPFPPNRATWRSIRRPFRGSPMRCRRVWSMWRSTRRRRSRPLFSRSLPRPTRRR